ncbi:MAG: hypothetical protein BroJett021_47750 [Chloroflexota bacterium]|nr:MAG: hypothetical protein BroJett021_47750 [Chloroflexota bacterium]
MLPFPYPRFPDSIAFIVLPTPAISQSKALRNEFSQLQRTRKTHILMFASSNHTPAFGLYIM